METVREQLSAAQKQGRLVEIFRYGDEHHFLTGNVIAIDEKFVLIKRINTNGATDGAIVLRINTVSKVVATSDYLKSLVAVIALARERHYNDIWHVEDLLSELNLAKHSILKAALKWAFKADQVASLGIHPGKSEKTYTGFVAELKTHKVHFNDVNPSDLTARWQVKLAYADLNYVEIGSFKTYSTTAILERYMAEDFH
ncbi:hypothetical protein FD04_GL000710 [Secundilactobacillus odoratitofui DSM 19909 = JCM 15043]|uniref:Uncharacterized protein n=1 Tax=Secundilactobacillus odoratitofui DSM 19909 = JCM 15043 TaxID=1423776 RepID=A0A0R1LPD3_9LACO|nr:hypothetical protein [Secundilactobacillus odoratitofui]KRK97740.1 hypothetical protein FD04_GL000710 [Secundilactobacillus odoratitofui DSM 19909 = JCM 15043]